MFRQQLWKTHLAPVAHTLLSRWVDYVTCFTWAAFENCSEMSMGRAAVTRLLSSTSYQETPLHWLPDCFDASWNYLEMLRTWEAEGPPAYSWERPSSVSHFWIWDTVDGNMRDSLLCGCALPVECLCTRGAAWLPLEWHSAPGWRLFKNDGMLLICWVFALGPETEADSLTRNIYWTVWKRKQSHMYAFTYE